MATLDWRQLQQNLDRVGLLNVLAATAPPTLQTLQQLHAAHTTTIPFENLSLHGYPQVHDWCALRAVSDSEPR